MTIDVMFRSPVMPESIAHSPDGSALFAYFPEDQDGFREVQRYERAGTTMVLRRSATYRRLAEGDGQTWERVGDDRIH